MTQPAETEEVYATLPFLPGYRIRQDGTIWTCWHRSGRPKRMTSHWRKLAPARHKSQGYLYITLQTVDGRKKFRVNVLTLWAFTGHRPEGMEASHKNGVRTDNRVSNLEWKTHAENMADKYTHGTVVCGLKSMWAKLTPESVRAIRAMEGQSTFEEIGRMFGVTGASTRAVIRRETWKHVD